MSGDRTTPERVRESLHAEAKRNSRDVFTEDEVVDLVTRLVDGEPDAFSLLFQHRECTAEPPPDWGAIAASRKRPLRPEQNGRTGNP